MTITRDEAIRSATRFVERKGWRDWWSTKRLAANLTQHPYLGRDCWCVQSLPVTTDPTITTVWLDGETGDPVTASRNSRAGLEEWNDSPAL
jgi:hypothetical protein